MKKGLTNVAASVRARLLNKARAEERPFAELLQYYAMERFLYRLSESPHRDRFVLKGALMFSIWGGPATRATKDIDLLSSRTEGVNALVGVVSECLQTSVPSDGLTFDAGSVTGEEIRIDAEYNGVRVRFRGTLGSARVSVQVDFGFGDVVTPEAELLQFPTLLDLPPPTLAMYTPETTIAEKLEAMVALGEANTRLKDFLDIWVLARGRDFAGPVFADAIRGTFQRRRTELPRVAPIALAPEFYESPTRKLQWAVFLRKARVVGAPQEFGDVAEEIRSFIGPVLDSLASGSDFDARWPAGGPWTR